MKKFLPLVLFVVCFNFVNAQTPYTDSLFSIAITSNIEYGQATNFAGFNDTLLMDLYKPVGDSNCQRPCIVLVHGGAWVQGSKDVPEVVQIAEFLAEKGWVVATVNYRLGTHKPSNPTYSDWWNCPNPVDLKCWHIADTAEAYRANYRAQQDVKGAIRFLKNRHALDSSDVNNVFVAGFSAGGFISLATTFMDDPSEKPADCGAIADAPTPHPELAIALCLPTNYSLSRPDLGDINGDLNLGGYDASVQGVGSFFGGMFNYDMLANTTNWPEIYMFHQANDVIVGANSVKLLARLNGCYSALGNQCMPFSHYPISHGSRSIDTYLNGVGGVNQTTEIVENFLGIPLDCVASPAGHSIDAPLIRAQNMINSFADRVASNGNTPTAPPCNLGLLEKSELEFLVYPVPSNDKVTIENGASSPINLLIHSADGKLIQSLTVEKKVTVSLNPGIYFITGTNEDGIGGYRKVIIH